MALVAWAAMISLCHVMRSTECFEFFSELFGGQWMWSIASRYRECQRHGSCEVVDMVRTKLVCHTWQLCILLWRCCDVVVSSADLTCTDNSGATAWDYARGKQLHYCMLIIASYLRQNNRGLQSHRDSAHNHRDFMATNQSSLFDSEQLQVGVFNLPRTTFTSSTVVPNLQRILGRT